MSDDTELRLRLSVMANKARMEQVAGGLWYASSDNLIAFARAVASDCAQIAANIGPIMHYEIEKDEITSAIRARYNLP